MRHIPLFTYSLLLLLSGIPLLMAAAPQTPRVERPNPDADGHYHVGDGVTAPTVIFAPEPKSTEEARQKRVSGTVSVWVMVETDGSPKDVRVARSLAEGRGQDYKEVGGSLDKNALEAVQRYRFKPATFHGKPVPVEIQVKCTYKP